MGVNKGSDRYLVTDHGKVMSSGSSTKLGKNQIGLFNLSKVDKDGAKAVDVTSIITADKNETKFEIRQGIDPKSGVTRTLSNKGKSSMPFKLSEVVKAWVSTPTTTEQKFDELYIGYNGYDTKSSFRFKSGQYFSTEITLWGKPIGMFNIGGDYTVKYSTQIPEVEAWDTCAGEVDFCTPVDCRKETLKMVQFLRNYKLPNDVPLTNVMDIDPVFSTTQKPNIVDHKVMELTYNGFEGHGEIGKVQAQYPFAKVVRDDFSGKFQMLVPATTTVDPYKQTIGSLIPGCDGCPEGFDEVEGGFVYAIKATTAPVIEDVVVEQVGVDKGTGVKYFLALSPEKLTDAIVAGVAGEVIFVGEKGATCINDAETTTAWVEVGRGTATTRDYTIVLADDCNGSRITELQEYYPDLVITTVGDAKNCIRKYKTTVKTDVQFQEGCPNADVLEKVYTAEAPAPFDYYSYWIEDVTEEEAEGLSCGVRIKGKPVIVNSDDEGYRDILPFIATSVRLKAVSGYFPSETMDLNTYSMRQTDRFNVTKVQDALDLDNLGGDMKLFERAGNAYFLNEEYLRGNLYGRYATGTESILEGLTQYNDYAFEIRKVGHSQGLGQLAQETIIYHIQVPSGNSKEVEKLHKAIAGGAGIPIRYSGQKA